MSSGWTFRKNIQYGVGTPNGCHHVILQSREDFRSDPERILMTVDVTNAFNCLDRNSIGEALKPGTKFEKLLGYFYFCYTTPETLLVQDKVVIHSARGVRKGDPLGPLLFALGIQHVFQEVATRFENQISMRAYLDDITLLGLPDHGHAALTFLSASLKKIALQINKSKYEARPNPSSYERLFGDAGQNLSFGTPRPGDPNNRGSDRTQRGMKVKNSRQKGKKYFVLYTYCNKRLQVRATPFFLHLFISLYLSQCPSAILLTCLPLLQIFHSSRFPHIPYVTQHDVSTTKN